MSERTITREEQIDEAYDRLDALAGKLMLKFGTEATAKMLTVLARKYCDIFKAEIERAAAFEAMGGEQGPGGKIPRA